MRSDRWFVPAGYYPARMAVIALIAALALVDRPVQAQQPAPKDLTPKASPPAAPVKPKAAQPKAPAAQPKEAPVAQPKEAPTPAAPPQQTATPPAQPPQLSYSPWTKFCTPDAQAKQVCITAKDGRLEDGRIVVSAAVIEPEGEQKKILKVMLLPLGLQISSGTRVVVDQGQPMSGPYATCFVNACFSDYEATAELVARMKQGQTLIVQGMGLNNQVISLPVPLKDFARAYDGPPLDAKAFEEIQKKLQEELERKARALPEKVTPPAPGTTP
jgi:invasion protein IalB